MSGRQTYGNEHFFEMRDLAPEDGPDSNCPVGYPNFVQPVASEHQGKEIRSRGAAPKDTDDDLGRGRLG